MQEKTRKGSNEIYEECIAARDPEALRRLCLEDLFFLISRGCKRQDLNNDWLYARCREVEAEPNGYIDLWSREHYKSTIITYGLTIQDILNNPDLTVGIFSHTRPIAKAFLSQIKREFELNTFLQGLFPEILYPNPQKQSPKWSLDDGIIVKRRTNPKEATIEAHGLVDGQPTSKHYSLMVYDDVVTKESVSTGDMIKKVTNSFELSLNLGAQGGVKRYIGTRYHANDTYSTIMKRGTAIPRLYPATDDGTFKGKPVLLSQESFDEKVRDMGSYTASCQLLQNPLADNAMGFNRDWIMQYSMLRDYSQWNFYILVDPAGEKKKDNDYTVMVVIGLAPDGNYYLVDGLRDRMNLTERTNALFRLHRKWLPKATGYEKYGMQSDIEHIKYIQDKVENYRFHIEELGGSTPKNDRIRKLVPVFENRRFFIPFSMPFKTVDDKLVDFVRVFLEDEYDTFPVSSHDDMFDCIARIMDEKLNAVFPKVDGSVMNTLPIKMQEYDFLDTKNTRIYEQEYNPLAV